MRLAICCAAFLALAPAAPAQASACSPNVRATASVRQLVTVEAAGTASTRASLRIWERAADGCWRAAGGPWPARVGRNGLSTHHREGDGTTPAGAFGFGAVVYGVAADPGVRLRYHRLICGDWWDEDPRSPSYNTFRHVRCGTRPAFGGGSEALWRQTRAYRHFAVIGYNVAPAAPGRGSATFLHADTGEPTNGCVSLRAAALVRVLRWLDPAARPLIAIGTRGGIGRF